MNNIPERYQVSAMPIIGKERIQGYLSKGRLFDYKNFTLQPSIDREENGLMITTVIDPATVEPVRVKPIFDPTEYLPESIYCPNCNYDLMGGIDPDAEHDPPHCWECGQALNWQND